MDKRRFTNNPIPTKIGDRFHQLVVIGEAEPYGKKNVTRWLCRCDCGKETVTYQSHLRRGMTQSCGCRKRKQWKECVTTHGKSKAPEYQNWAGMKARCYNPNTFKFKDYGGRGIEVCSRWKDSFENFFADMGERPTPRAEIDRIDNNGNYEPSNCRWATRAEQNRNRRDNVFITINGQSKVLKDWCAFYNLPYNTIATRFFTYKWSAENALFRPIGKYKSVRRNTDGFLADAVNSLDVKEIEGVN